MQHAEVKSQAMKSVGYHDGVMEITFNGGKTTSFHDVPAKLHEELMAAESKGKFFAQKIRGRFAENKPAATT